ncbi:MAG: hypothetical protein OJF55_000650 [Rhodanobacteraceae bacterium]|nr:MAG: hypothetical protein OJF55_000650 [Rhodanobacteraceae bacterium]
MRSLAGAVHAGGRVSVRRSCAWRAPATVRVEVRAGRCTAPPFLLAAIQSSCSSHAELRHHWRMARDWGSG